MAVQHINISRNHEKGNKDEKFLEFCILFF